MRKAIVWTLALCVSVSLLGGCGSKQEAASGSERGYYYEGPMKPKSERGARTGEQLGGGQ